MKTIVLILTIFIAACVETDIFLPALPDMMIAFTTSEGGIQSLLTWNFIGMCLSGPLYGPLSDSYGRRIPLLTALAIFFLGSLLTLQADDLCTMLWGRVLQGVGSGGCFTLGTAILFDLFQGEAAVRAVNKINAIAPFIMATAPLLGGYLNYHYGFRSNFVAIALLVAISLVTSLLCYRETLPVTQRIPLNRQKIVADFATAWRCIPFWRITAIVSLLNAGYLALLAGSAVLFVVDLGVSKATFPFFQASVLVAWLAASLSLGPLLSRFGAEIAKSCGIILVMTSSAAFAIAAWLGGDSPYFLTAAMMLYAWGVNWTQSLYFPEAIELLPDIKGVAASLLTSTRLLITAAVVGVTSACYNGTAIPLAIMIAAITISITTLHQALQKQIEPLL